MPTCAFLTITDLSDFVSDDDLAVDLLRKSGWRVDFIPWDQPAGWSRYDLVVIRTTWDYHERPSEFLNALDKIDQSPARLLNSLALVRWNLDKRYLLHLERKQVPIVPTRYGARLNDIDELLALFTAFETHEIILKPPVNVNAFNTFRLHRTGLEAHWPRLSQLFGAAPYLAQPFMPYILNEGEFSLIYFDGRFSHAILKTPAAGDFRVQEEHGGVITAVEAGEALRHVARRALDSLDEIPLYARLDLVRHTGDDFRIMEFELIEPSLYLRMHPDAPRRFSEALQAALLRP